MSGCAGPSIARIMLASCGLLADAQTGRRIESCSRNGAGQRTERGRRRNASRLRVAALDLGTNNCRLLIARRRATAVCGSSIPFRASCGWARAWRKPANCPSRRIERTIAALKICAEHIRAKGVARVRAIATEACRRAAQCDVLARTRARRSRHRAGRSSRRRRRRGWRRSAARR